MGANYEEAGAGQKKADFIARLAVARKECRESLFWLRVISEKRLLEPELIENDLSEALQLNAIFRAIIEKARSSPHRG